MNAVNPVKITLHGFSGGPALNYRGAELTSGIPEVVALYREFLASSTKFSTWAFRKRAVEIALKLFDPNEGFDFISQDKNPRAVDYNYDFIVDTLNYIATGKRKFDTHLWLELMTQLPDANQFDIRQRNTIEKTFDTAGLSTNPVDLVQKWCSHKGGIEDMVCSMHLLFGEREVKTARPLPLST